MAATIPATPVNSQAVAAQIAQHGFASLADAVPADWLERARAHVRSHLDRNGEKFFSIIRPADERGSPFDELVHSPAIVSLLEQVARCLRPGATFDDGVYNVLRVIAGPSGSDGACEFHYDASVVTMLVPIFIPEGDPATSGALLALPANRPYRSTVLANLFEKALIQNRWAWRRTERRARVDLDETMQRLKPGNLYLFEGYRTLHGNLPCAPHSLRATLLLHHGDPHGGSALLGAVRWGRRWVESRRRTRG